MARIPLGDWGNVVARPVERPSGGPDAYGAGVGQALQNAGSIGMRAAGQEMDQAAAEADRAKRQDEADAKQAAREVAAEVKAAQRQAEAEAKAAAREAARVKALTASATITNGLNDLHDEIQNGLADGTVDKGKALETFQTRAQKLQAAGIEGVDPENRPLVEASLLDNVGRTRRSVAGLVAAREKADIMSGGMAYFEEMQRFAVRGPKEADQAIANVRAFWTATGPMAGDKDAQARVQQFAERVRFTQATALVNADPGAALKALKDPKYLPELDPGARTNLIQTADVRVTQAVNRAEVANAAAARRLETQWNALSTVFDAGKMLDPVAAEAARRQFKGTPYAAALDAMMTQAPAVTAFASQPLAAQSQSLMAFQAQMNTKGATPEQIAEYKKRETVYNAAVADYAKDPYQAAAERGVIVGVAPLSLDIQALPAQLAARAEDARKVSVAAGREVSLFRPEEAEKIGGVLLAMPPKDRAGALVGLSKVMTVGQRAAFAKQIEPKDQALALALAYTDRQTTSGRYTSELILRGQQARLDKTSTKGLKQPDAAVGQWSAEFADSLADVYPNQQTADQVREAAMLISHGIAAEQGGELSTKDRQRALRLAVGGEVVEHNGRKIPLPAGVDEDGLAKRLRTVTPADIKTDTVRAGGVPMPAAEFLKTLPGLPLMPYRAGQFTPLVGGRPVVDGAGRPVIIEVR
jgi:hypothetical protein